MTRFCVARSGWPTMLMLAFQQFETDLVAIERDRRHGYERPSQPLVILQRDDCTFDRLIVLRHLLLHEPHVAQHLADNDIARPSSFELDDKEPLLVFADCQDIDWS